MTQAKVQDFIKGIKHIAFFSNKGLLPENCKLYAARNTAWNAARDAAWNAAADAALLAVCLLAGDSIPPEHLTYALRRWQVWESGYGVLNDVNGVLYCYKHL